MLRHLLRLAKRQVNHLNKYGIPLPMVRDPKTGIGSVSLTLVVIASIMVILGLVGKWSGKLGTIDINNSLEFFYASSALYFSRNWRSAKTGSFTKVSDDPGSDQDKDQPVGK